MNIFKRNPKTSLAGGAAAIALSISALIQPWEGLRLKAYPDIVKVWTVCWGETQGIKPGMEFTKAECDRKLLVRVTDDYYAPLARCIPNFSQAPVGLQAAGISLTYNIGVGAACNSTFARKTTARDYKGACEALLKFNRAGGRVVQGLVNRRSAEYKVCVQ